MSNYRRIIGPASALVAVLWAISARAAEPLHARIDQIVAAAIVGPASPIADDAEFLRRVYLDLTGEIPSPAAAREFLDDKSPEKRAALVDRLLAGSAYPRHMAGLFNVMLMERRADKVIPQAEWQQYLRASLASNKPYNQLAREILAADGTDSVLRPAAKFYLDRDGDPNLLTRDVGRIFFGRDFQCAQCHDHPVIDTYYQADYYGLFACFNRGALFTDKDKKVFYAEKGEGGVAFESVFDKDAKGNTRPRLPGGAQLAEPQFAAGDEYTVKPADGVRTVPKYSRRARLAEEATSGANRAFNENIANRLWAHMLGRGLVEPLDLHHADNPPSHPELLALLTDELVAMKFDVKAFLREIALSQTYQRAIDLPEQQLSAADDRLAAEATAIEAELQKLTGLADESSKTVSQAHDELVASRAAAVAAAGEVTKLATAMAETKKAADAAQQALAQAQAALVTKQDVATAVTEAATQTEQAAQKLPQEKPLTDAAAKFRERATQLAAEVAAAAKAATEKTEPAKAASDKLAAEQKAIEDAGGKERAAGTQVEGLEAKSAGALAKIQTDRAKAKQVDRRLQAIKSLIAYRVAKAARDADQTVLAKADTELAAVKQSRDKLAGELPAKNAALEQTQKQHAEAMKALSETQQQFAAKNDASQSLATAAAKAEVARQKLPADTELAQAAQTVKARADQLAAEVAEVQKQLATLQLAANQSASGVAAAKQAVDSTAAEIAKLDGQVPALESQRKAAADKATANQQTLASAADDLLQHETRQFATAALKPLSPEQLARTTMRAVGLTDQLRAASEAEINAKTPLTDAIRGDPAQMAAREQQIDEATDVKVQANAARFVELFATGAGQPQDFFATADQALFFANDGLIRSWLAPAGGNLSERLNKLTEPKALAEELYLSILTRRPTDPEIAEATTYLATRANERAAAVQELAWGLITSLEFRFNH